MTGKKIKSTPIRLDPELFEKASARADRLDRSFASYIRHLILRDLEEEEKKK